MKSIISSIFLFLSFATAIFGQVDFKVIKVNGTIVLRTKGVNLETGTVFTDRDDLVFRSDDATAAVINPQKGRVVITSRSHDLSSARSNYLPSMYNISSRGISILSLSGLKSNFAGKYVVLDRQGVEIDTDDFPMDNDHFFFFRYNYKGEEINKKLPFSGDTLFVDKKALFTVDGTAIPMADNTKIRLYYRKSNESVLISEFDLIFPDMVQLKKETGIILNEVKDKSAGEKVAEVGSFIGEFYGNIQPEYLTEWLQKEFGIK